MRIPGRPTKQRLDALAGIGLLAAAGFFGYLAFNSGDKPAVVARKPAPKSTTTTSTTISRVGTHDFKRGDCVDWDDAAAVHDASIVSCKDPHWVELAAKVEVTAAPGAPYPDLAAWDRLTNENCPTVVNKYLLLDPLGRFGLGIVLTDEEAWNRGDRNIWCGIRARADRITNVGGRTKGRVKDLDQALLNPPGTCLLALNGLVANIPCAQMHHYEVVGELDLTQSVTKRPTTQQWTAYRKDCVPVAEKYLGRKLASSAGLTVASPELNDEQWAAGTRRVECQVLRVDAGGVAQPVAGSFRDGA